MATMAVLGIRYLHFVPYFLTAFFLLSTLHITVSIREQRTARETIFQRIGNREGQGNLVVLDNAHQLSPFLQKGLLVPYGVLLILIFLQKVKVRKEYIKPGISRTCFVLSHQWNTWCQLAVLLVFSSLILGACKVS